MAEFCLECYNRLRGGKYKRWQVVLRKDLCEGCGRRRGIVVFFWTDWLWPFSGR
ncbi:MAG: hypothetical protein Q4C13_02075 [Clostridia bacterium]|nr:hypothetical protein [Clostridia bacterium]